MPTLQIIKLSNNKAMLGGEAGIEVPDKVDMNLAGIEN